jgi:hypothetical protein
MEIRLQKKDTPPLRGIEPVLTAIQGRLDKEPQAWLKQLQADPGAFADLEKNVHRAFQQMADQVMAGLLAQATAPPAFADDAKKK